MGDFEDVHRDRIVGSLAMFDRLIFKGHLTAFYRPGAVRGGGFEGPRTRTARRCRRRRQDP